MSLASIILVAAAAVAVPGIQSTQPKDFSECGVSAMGVPRVRVISGKNVSAGDYPFAVKIVYAHDVFCTGSIISELDILTAAHCLPIFREKKTLVYAGTSHIYANGSFDGHTVGTKNYEARNTGVTMGVQSFVLHPTYRPATREGIDVAVLKLKKPLVFNENIRKICLAAEFDDEYGHMGFVVGWGFNKIGGEALPQNARDSNVPILPTSTCVNAIHRFNPITNLCGGGVDRGTQTGDSGGPLMVHNYGKFFQVGIISNGFTDNSTTFQQLDYGNYVRTTILCDFLESATNGRANCIKMKSASQ